MTDWLSVGAGPAITYGSLDLKLKAAVSPPLDEPTVKLEDMTDWAVAPVVSVLIEPTERLRFGVVYQGETELNLDGDIDVPFGISSSGISLELDALPAAGAKVGLEGRSLPNLSRPAVAE